MASEEGVAVVAMRTWSWLDSFSSRAKLRGGRCARVVCCGLNEAT